MNQLFNLLAFNWFIYTIYFTVRLVDILNANKCMHNNRLYKRSHVHFPATTFYNCVRFRKEIFLCVNAAPAVSATQQSHRFVLRYSNCVNNILILVKGKPCFSAYFIFCKFLPCLLGFFYPVLSCRVLTCHALRIFSWCFRQFYW